MCYLTSSQPYRAYQDKQYQKMQLPNQTNSHHFQVVSSKAASQRGMVSSLLLVLFVAAILLVAVLSLIVGYKMGYRLGVSDANEQAKLIIDSEELTAENVKALRVENELLVSQVATAKQERDISLTNLTDLRENEQALEVKNLQLEQVNKVFANALIREGGLPLQIIGAQIEPLPEGAFEYRFDVVMLDNDGKTQKLRPVLQLLNDTSFVDVPLDPSSYDIDGVARIRGRFMMPKGFNPQQAKLTLKAGGETAEQLYNWRLGKQVEDMPMSLAEIPEADQRPIEDANSASNTESDTETDAGASKSQ